MIGFNTKRQFAFAGFDLNWRTVPTSIEMAHQLAVSQPDRLALRSWR
jgi:hypothetical protein